MRGTAGTYLVAVKDCDLVGEILGHKIFVVRDVTFLPFHRPAREYAADVAERQAAQIGAVKKLLEAGDFYFSLGFNLTRSLQSSSAIADNSLEEFDDWLDSFEPEFFWNQFLLRHFIRNQIKGALLTRRMRVRARAACQ